MSTGFLPDHDWLPLVTHGFPPSDGEVWERLLPETPSDAQIQVLAALADNPHQWDPDNEHAAAARSCLGLGSMSREELRALVDRHRAAGSGGRVTRVSRRRAAAARAAQSAQPTPTAQPTLPTPTVVQPARAAQSTPAAQPAPPTQPAQPAPPTLPTPIVPGPQPGQAGDAGADGGAGPSHAGRPARAPQP